MERNANESKTSLVKFLAICIASAIIGAAFVAIGLPRSIQAAFEGTGSGVSQVAKTTIDSITSGIARLTSTNVTNTFEQIVLASKSEHELHVATWKGYLSMGKVEETGWTRAEVLVRKPAQVPVYVSLKRSTWKFDVQDDTLYVYPPAIDFGPPSVDNAHAARLILDSSWRISESRMLEEAESELDRKADQLGKTQAQGIRDSAREGVSTFIRDWVLKPYFPKQQDAKVVVVFPDERK